MPKKLGGTDDFNPKKQNRINDFREGRRFSFRVGGDKPKPDTECGKLEIPDYSRDKKSVGRGSGDAVLYSGEQLENYKKQYPRFERAIDLIPDGKVTRDGNEVYLFCSKQSPTGYWEVTAFTTIPSYFIDAGAPLQILCPIPFQITQVQSNGKSFTWTQLEGGRLATVDPDNTIDPTLYILDDVRDYRPIRFEIAVAEDPTVKDTLTVYTTPTSTFDGVGAIAGLRGNDVSPSRKVPYKLTPAVPYPKYAASSYQLNPNGELFASWDLPLMSADFLVSTSVQVNTTGEYLTVATIPKNQPRIFGFKPRTHYRILSEFNTYGVISYSNSSRFYNESTNVQVAADESFKGLGAIQKARQNTLPLSRKLLSVDSDKFRGLGATQKSSKVTLPLNAKRLVARVSTYQGLGATQKTSYRKFDLGGIIIT